ncbi:Nucleoporin Nup43 [Lunasporangiospora selenospora]|uniref:Nucleoporin Nup43 n=1 Tax=Lunasporangiospora selenospora TaxID=979761 RepID=A0A9P6KFY3_9FUNG|nr:Nucleoporin Nup43 [Lunasporangiospora selenospora]
MSRKEIDQYTVPRKVSRVRWLDSTSFPAKELHFITGLHLDGKSDTVALWRTKNQRQYEITRSEDIKSTFSPTRIAEAPHRGEILDMRLVEDGQDTFIVTASSTGEIGLYKADIKSDAPLIDRLAVHRHHGFPGLGVAEATSVSVRPQAFNEIASVGGDSKLVLMNVENIEKTLQRSERVGAGMSTVCWRSSTSLAVATKNGQIRLYDRRNITKPVLPPAKDPQRIEPLTSLAQHPTDPHRLVTGNEDGCISVWDVRNLSSPEVRSFKVHTSIVWEVLFHPNESDKVISCSQDGTMATLDWRQAASESILDASKTRDQRVATYWSSIRSVLSINSIDYHARANALLAGSDSGGILHSLQ